MAEQPLPVPGREDVTEAVIRLLRSRQAKGIATYGRSLETFNGRNSLDDAIEECADMLQYLVQLRLELTSLGVLPHAKEDSASEA